MKAQIEGDGWSRRSFDLIADLFQRGGHASGSKEAGSSNMPAGNTNRLQDIFTKCAGKKLPI